MHMCMKQTDIIVEVFVSSFENKVGDETECAAQPLGKIQILVR